MRLPQSLIGIGKKDATTLGIVEAWKHFHDHPEAGKRKFIAQLIDAVPVVKDPQHPVWAAYLLSYEETLRRLIEAPLTTPAELGIADNADFLEYDKSRKVQCNIVMTDYEFANTEDLYKHIKTVCEMRAETARERAARDEAITERKREKMLSEEYRRKLEARLGVEVVGVLKKLSTPIEFIIIGLNHDGLSQDAIVDELRHRNIGKSKSFVGQVIRKYRGIIHGLIDPASLKKSEEAGCVYAEDSATGKTSSTKEETVSAAHPLYAADVDGALREWREGNPQVRADCEAYYGDLLSDAICQRYHGAPREELPVLWRTYGPLLANGGISQPPETASNPHQH